MHTYSIQEMSIRMHIHTQTRKHANTRKYVSVLKHNHKLRSHTYVVSTIKCSNCDGSTTKIENTQDISLHIKEDASLTLRKSQHDFFQPETLDGENAYWCDTCQTTCRATKTLSCTRNLTILIIHLKRLILGKKIQTHTSFDTNLDLEPNMLSRSPPPHDMKLLEIISHHSPSLSSRV